MGNGPGDDLSGDESLLRAIILNAGDALPVEGEPVLAGASVDTITETTANASAILSNSDAQVTLFWDTEDNGSGEWPNSNAFGTRTVGAISGGITGLKPDTRYFYRFLGTNTTTDDNYKDWSENAQSFGTKFAPSQAISKFRALANDFETIDLSWTDDFNSETGFRIERALSTTNDWITVATVPAQATSYQDHSLSGNTSYHYRVSAINEAGVSTPSKALKVTTPAPPPSKLVTVADYDFENNRAPAGFQSFGAPKYKAGKLVLDGKVDYLQLKPAPIGRNIDDNFVLEFIVDAHSFGDFNFVGSIGNANGANRGYGILAQGTEWRALTCSARVEGALSHGPPPTFLAAVAYVRDSGNNALYVNGVKYSRAPNGRFTLTDDGVLTIGGHVSDAPKGLFGGEIDRVRISTFAPGEFQVRDLLGPGDGAIGR